MPIQHYEQPKYHRLPLVRALFAANLLFATATLVAWQSALIILLGPLIWAADETLPQERGLAHIFEYPLVVFWAGPAFAMAFGWVLIQGRNYRAAFGVLALPVIVMALIFVMYWTVPGARQ